MAILILTAGCLSASAQYEQYVTITVTPDASSNVFSNSYSIMQNQAVELMAYKGFESSLTVSYGGAIFNTTPGAGLFYAADSTGGKGTIIQGPATFTLSGVNLNNAFVTLKIIPEAYDPNKTLIVPPGTNHVQITLQVSPDLVNWTTATNGVYGSPTTAQFFRIREDNLVSP